MARGNILRIEFFYSLVMLKNDSMEDRLNEFNLKPVVVINSLMPGLQYGPWCGIVFSWSEIVENNFGNIFVQYNLFEVPNKLENFKKFSLEGIERRGKPTLVPFLLLTTLIEDEGPRYSEICYENVDSWAIFQNNGVLMYERNSKKENIWFWESTLFKKWAEDYSDLKIQLDEVRANH